MRMTVSDAADPALRLLRCRHTPSSRSVAPCRRSARRRCSNTTAPTVEWQTDVNPHRHLASAKGDTDLALHIAVLLGLAPAAVEQGAGRRHTGRRWRGLGAANTRQRADAQRGLRPRQRSNICCGLGHLGSSAHHYLVDLRAAYRSPGAGYRAWESGTAMRDWSPSSVCRCGMHGR